MTFNPNNIQIHECLFEVSLAKVAAKVRFPASLFVSFGQCKTLNIVKLQNGICEFNEHLREKIQIPYDRQGKKYVKKQLSVIVSLISERRSSVPKIIGRLRIQLSDVLNSNAYSKMETHKLQYCPVDASITLNVKVKCRSLTKKTFEDLENQVKRQLNPEYVKIKEVEEMDFEEVRDYFSNRWKNFVVQNQHLFNILNKKQ